MKIAWFTPFSRKSAIGQCSAIVVQELARSTDVTVFASDINRHEESWLPDHDTQFLPNLAMSDVLRVLGTYEIAIYNLGDHMPYHVKTFEVAQQHPGIVILHDLVMTHFFSGYYWVHLEKPEGFENEMVFSHGEAGRELARPLIDGTATEYIWDKPLLLEYNMARSAVHGSYGIVVHSQYAQRALNIFAAAPVRKVNFPTPWIVDRLNKHQRGKLPDTGGKVQLLTFGMVNPNKMVAEIIEIIAQSSQLRRQTVYHVVGPTEDQQYATKLKELIEKYNLSDTVQLLGYQPDNVLFDYLIAADVITNLRNPYFGEASWSLLEALFIGKPTVVWKYGYYDEFPNDVVAKVDSLNGLRKTLEQLCSDVHMRRKLGQRGQQYARRNFSTEQYCQAVLEFAEATCYNKPVLDLADQMSRFLIELGGDQTARNLTHTIALEISNLIG